MSRHLSIRLAVLFLLAPLWLAGCSVIPSSEPVKIQGFDLGLAAAAGAVQGPQAGPVVALAPPQMHPGLVGDGLAYREARQELAYYARNRWVAPPAELLEEGLPALLAGTPGIGAVIGEVSRGRADWRLETRWHHFEQDFRHRPSRGHVQVEVQLVEVDSGRILASRLLDAEAEAPSDDPHGGVQALREALRQVVIGLRALLAETAADSGAH